MKKIVISLASTVTLFVSSAAAWACTSCRPLVKSGVYDEGFTSTLIVLLLPLGVLAVIGAGLYFFGDRLFGFAPATVKAVPQTQSSGSTRLPQGTGT